MNDKRRKSLRAALQKLSEVSTIVEAVCDAEQDCLDNCPENLQGTDRYERMEDAIDRLNDAMFSLDEVCDHIQSVI